MRKETVIFLFLLAACTKVPAPSGTFEPSDKEIAFGVSDGLATRGQAALTTKAALAQTDFSLSAWFTPQGETFDVPGGTAVRYFENHRFGYVSAALEGETTFPNAWQGVKSHGTTGAVEVNPVYWPLDGTLSFFGYAPYRADATLLPAPVPDTRDIAVEAPLDPTADAAVISRLPNYLIGSPMVRFTPPAAAADQVDFLCSAPLLDKSRTDNAGTIQLDLRHRLTQIKFGFNYSGVLADPVHHFVQVSSIELRGVVSSKYLYYTETIPYATDCVWSEAVSPADKTNPAAALPTADYRIDTATGGLLSGPSGDVPAKDGGNTNHLMLSTDAGVLYLLPQEIPVGAELVINYYTGEQHGVPLTSDILTVPLRTATLTAWPMGKQVRYLITLNIPNQQFSGLSAQVYEWEDSGNVDNGGTPHELLPHD